MRISKIIMGALVAAAATVAQADVQRRHHPTQAGMCETLFGGSIGFTACSDSDPRQWVEVETRATKPASPPSTPTKDVAPPPVDPPKTDPVNPPPVPSSAAVPLTMRTSAASSGYASAVAGPYRVINNTWDAKSINGTWSQAVGIGPLQADGSVDFRVAWDYRAINFKSCGGGCEIIGFPEIAYGRSASFPKEASAKLPMRIADIQVARSSYSKAEASGLAGQSHLVYDLWTSFNPDNLGAANRGVEIMLPEYPIGGYGVPNAGAAAAGRSGTATGRSMCGYKRRVTIDGDQFDFFWSKANSDCWKLRWDFVVLQPVNHPGAAGKTRDWRKVLDFLQAEGVVKGSDYLSDIELGVEPAYRGSAGDMTVRNFRVEVR